ITTPRNKILEFRGAKEGPNADIQLKNWRVLIRTIWGGHTYFFESFRRGEWETSDLYALLLFGELNETSVDKVMKSTIWRRLIEQVLHKLNQNSLKGSKRNIAAHYDLGNSFYQLWLDKSMTYSSALFKGQTTCLSEAQRQKYLRIANKIELKDGDKLLEIGCGWGGFAEIAAKEYGCQVTGLTLSKEQASSCKKRLKDSGIERKVDIRLEDYRDVKGLYDKIVSIEMLEAVGEKFWRRYFESIRDRLAPGGKAAIQTIIIKDDCFESYKKNPDFIQQFIFPGGMLPTPSAIKQNVEAVGLKLTDTFYFGKSYIKTLHLWDQEFKKQWSQIEELGFDTDFKNTWTYYLNYCAAGFQSGRINVGQFLIQKS
ncbi:MAG: class I SAM-dependent methyltransferase, partial [Alphaproteobacteria bacterium]